MDLDSWGVVCVAQIWKEVVSINTLRPTFYSFDSLLSLDFYRHLPFFWLWILQIPHIRYLAPWDA